MEKFSFLKTAAERSNHAKAASSIKKELKQAFPGIAFSVRSRSYAGGNSVDVSWDFGPTTKEVDAILKKYEMGDFDGMQDLYVYDRSEEKAKFQAEHGSVKYAMSSRHFGPASGPDWFENSIYGQIGKDLCKLQRVEYKGENTRNLFGQHDSLDLRNYVNLILSKSSLPPGWKYQGLADDDSDNRIPFALVGAKGAPASAPKKEEPIPSEDVSKEEEYLSQPRNPTLKDELL